MKIPILNLPEKLIILTIDHERGTIPASIKNKLRTILVGALFSEMVLGNKIHLEDDRLVVNGPEGPGDPLFDEILSIMASEKKLRKINHWLDLFGKKEIVKKLAERLVERNVITIDKKQYLWTIPYQAYPKINASAKYWVKHELRSICLASEKADLHDIALLNLLKECQLLNLVFTRDERKSVFKKVESMLRGEVVDENTAKLVADLETLSVAVAYFARA